MSSRSERIEAAIRLEKLKHTKAVENRDCQRAVEDIIGDQSRRGILRAENVLNDSLTLRRASILAVPEMASSELFKELAVELEHTAETLTTVIPERLRARIGGVVNLRSGQLREAVRLYRVDCLAMRVPSTMRFPLRTPVERTM